MPINSCLNEVNMTNCCNQRRWFFEKYGSIDDSLLIAYWMTAGYLDPVESVEEGYEKGINVLMELKRKGMLSGTLKKNSATTSSDLNNHCSHKGHCALSNLGLDDLLDLPQLGKPTLTDGVLKDETGSLLLIDGSQVLESALTSLKGFKYIACFGNIQADSVKALLENVDNPSLLLFRKCGDTRSEIVYPLEKIASLTALGFSGSSYPKLNIPELTKLQFLNLSGIHEKELPFNFFYELKQLRWLILRSCPYLKALPFLNCMINLEVLDLSGSSQFCSPYSPISSPKLRVFECSGTAMKSIPQLETTQLTHLLMRCSKLEDFSSVMLPCSIQLLDLHRASELYEVNLSKFDALQVLDLSYTDIHSIDSVEDKVHLRKLILRACRRLLKLPALDKQTNLEVLDLSETGISCLPSFANQSRLQKLSLRKLELGSLETLSSLSGLVELDLRSVKISSSEGFKVDFLESLENLQTLNLSDTSVVDLPALTNHARLKELFLGGCQSLKRLPDVNTLRNLDKLVLINDSNASQSDSYQLFRDSMSTLLTEVERHLKSACKAATPANGNDDIHTRQLKKVIMDLKRVRKGRFKNSPNINKACELIKHLNEVYLCSSLSSEFPKLEILAQTVVKLKLLIPRTRTDDSQSSVQVKKKKEPKFKKVNYVDVIKKKLIVPKTTQQVRMESLHSPYESLSSNERRCLLCFSVFPLHVHEGNHKEVLLGKSLEIKKQMLIYWWAGEGFINIHSEQVTSDDKGNLKKTIEATGEDILRVLADKGFIQPVMKKSRETRRCSMDTFVHSFVTQQAKLENFFNFKNGELTPMLKGSHRACLLRSQDRIPSSCQFWAVYAKSPHKLNRFKMVKTLFNVDESVIHIQPEWFSEMKDLSVLHLGNWQSEDPEHIEVCDKTFMEGLKRMKQLKFFSLQGVSTITKLPDSVCKLTNLIILDLKECHDLEKLPAEIGSLKNLTHLDISNCHFLTKLPKGLRLLSKLEVLKGFVVYEHPGELQDKKENILSCFYKGHQIRGFLRREKNEVCTLRDLLNLQNLRKLSIVANSENFPDSNELEVFKQMENLRKLKILWRMNLMDDKKSYRSGQRGDSDKPAQDQGKNKNVDKKSGREYLHQIVKLELWCFPNKTAPDWLVPDELQNLKKLYIRGGKLKKLHERSSSKEWKVTTLRLRYLPKLKITWDALRAMFPNMTYLDKCECKKLRFFHCDSEGVWIEDYEKTRG